MDSKRIVSAKLYSRMWSGVVWGCSWRCLWMRLKCEKYKLAKSGDQLRLTWEKMPERYGRLVKALPLLEGFLCSSSAWYNTFEQKTMELIHSQQVWPHRWYLEQMVTLLITKSWKPNSCFTLDLEVVLCVMHSIRCSRCLDIDIVFDNYWSIGFFKRWFVVVWSEDKLSFGFLAFALFFICLFAFACWRFFFTLSSFFESGDLICKFLQFFILLSEHTQWIGQRVYKLRQSQRILIKSCQS